MVFDLVRRMSLQATSCWCSSSREILSVYILPTLPLSSVKCNSINLTPRITSCIEAEKMSYPIERKQENRPDQHHRFLRVVTNDPPRSGTEPLPNNRFHPYVTNQPHGRPRKLICRKPRTCSVVCCGQG